jgi:hypothetical protein
MKRTFIEFAAVRRALESAGVSDEAVRAMQLQIMQGGGDMIRGTGGLCKIRCAAAGRGKSGGVRIIFADYPEIGLCLLVAAFAKNVRENLDQAEQNDLAKLKAALDRKLKSRRPEENL